MTLYFGPTAGWTPMPLPDFVGRDPRPAADALVGLLGLATTAGYGAALPSRDR